MWWLWVCVRAHVCMHARNGIHTEVRRQLCGMQVDRLAQVPLPAKLSCSEMCRDWEMGALPSISGANVIVC